MQVTFLGTNGWFDTPAGNTICTLVQSEEYDIIFDAGNGIAKADRYISQNKPVFLFLSHFHIDHIAGLHTLCKFRLKKGLAIFGQPGTAALLDHFVSDPFTVPFAVLPFNVTVQELDAGSHELPFKVTCLPLIHPAPCFGYRLEIDNRIVTYCTDTGVCDNAVTLGKDADLLITECGLKSGDKSPEWPHLNPENAIGIARDARAKRLVLTHFGAEVYGTAQERLAVQERFSKDCPGLVAAMDNMALHI